MAYTDEELREMLLKANIELSRLTEKMLSMKAPAELIHKILSTSRIDDVEEDILNRQDHYKRVRSALNCLYDNDIDLPYNENVYFFNEDEGVSWGTIEELLSDDPIYDGEMFVLTVEDIVPNLLKPLLDGYIDDENTEGIRQVTESIAYVFEQMLEDDEDGE
nr:MAG TPA: aspartyl-tRNA synthetase [Caudoviricetes sp.]